MRLAHSFDQLLDAGAIRNLGEETIGPTPFPQTPIGLDLASFDSERPIPQPGDVVISIASDRDVAVYVSSKYL